jgi:hypothetical protein
MFSESHSGLTWWTHDWSLMLHKRKKDKNRTTKKNSPLTRPLSLIQSSPSEHNQTLKVWYILQQTQTETFYICDLQWKYQNIRLGWGVRLEQHDGMLKNTGSSPSRDTELTFFDIFFCSGLLLMKFSIARDKVREQPIMVECLHFFSHSAYSRLSFQLKLNKDFNFFWKSWYLWIEVFEMKNMLINLKFSI